MNKIYNPSTCRLENSERMTCPRCKGFGGLRKDEDGCTLCDGRGEVWKSSGNWVWPIGKTAEEGRLW